MPAARLLQGPSISELAEWLLAEVAASGAGGMAAQPETSGQAAAPQFGLADVDVDALSDDEVAALLDEMLAEGGQGR